MSAQSYIFRDWPAVPGQPLLFLFHGTGGDENQFFDLGRELLPQAGLVSPRGDVSEFGANRFFRRTGEGVYDMDDLARRTEAMAFFVEAQAQQRQATHVLGLGYSNGANILASVMFAKPRLFDAAVLMHPLIPFSPKIDGGSLSTPVLITAGRRDPICPPQMTTRLEAWLRDAGAPVELVWHGGGHELRVEDVEAARRFLAPWSETTGEEA